MTSLKNSIENTYHRLIHMLIKFQYVSRFFAHGGLHFLVLLMLLALAFYGYLHLKESNVTSFNQSIYTFYGDTLHNYKLNHIYFEKDISRKDTVKRMLNSVVLTHGFEYDMIDATNRTIKLFKNIDTPDSLYDLVSKIHYFKKDDLTPIKDDSPFKNYQLLLQKHQVMRVVKYSDHDRYYFSYSQLKDNNHTFYRTTHYIDTLEEKTVTNPYSIHWIGIIIKDSCQLNSASEIKVKYNKQEDLHSETGIGLPLQIESIFPEPTEKSLTEIVFKGKELQQVLQQGGVYITTLDPVKKANQEQWELLLTVILGAIIAFILDIIVEQIIKWRKLKE